jgi:hypothetical protein
VGWRDGGSHFEYRIRLNRQDKYRADLTDLKYVCLTGLNLLSGSAFHSLGKVNRGNLFTVESLCAGT